MIPLKSIVMFAHWWYSNSYLVHLGQSGKNVLIFAQQKQTKKKTSAFCLTVFSTAFPFSISLIPLWLLFSLCFGEINK